jgi:hypothetical protein
VVVRLTGLTGLTGLTVPVVGLFTSPLYLDVYFWSKSLLTLLDNY